MSEPDPRRHRRRLRAAARGSRAPARGVGLRGRRPGRRRRGPAAQGRRAQARRRRRRRPHAADPHRRGPARGAPRSAPSTRAPACSCSPSTSRRPTRSTCCRESTESTGYLLKDRVADVDTFTDAVRRVAGGGSALDPGGRRAAARAAAAARTRCESLTPREREVLGLMAEGRSNAAIAEALVVTERAVEKHVTSIFSKLDLTPDGRGPPPRARGARVPARGLSRRPAVRLAAPARGRISAFAAPRTPAMLLGP